MLNKVQDVISCAKHSKLKKEYHHEAIQELLEKPLKKKEHEFKQTKEYTLDSHFKNNKDLPSRNAAIIEALKDGYTQGELARYLGVSATLVSYVFRSSDTDN